MFPRSLSAASTMVEFLPAIYITVGVLFGIVLAQRPIKAALGAIGVMPETYFDPKKPRASGPFLEGEDEG